MQQIVNKLLSYLIDAQEHVNFSDDRIQDAKYFVIHLQLRYEIYIVTYSNFAKTLIIHVIQEKSKQLPIQLEADKILNSRQPTFTYETGHRHRACDSLKTRPINHK